MQRFAYLIFAISLLAAALFKPQLSFAQRDTVQSDTVKILESELPEHSPTKATLYSLFVPGLGQAYNRKFWKIPIIYAGIGAFSYIAVQQHKLFDEKRNAYVNRINGDSTDVYLQAGNFYSNDALLKSMDIDRRNRDFMIILAAGIYALQIVDAAVDAHLFYFNVSDDLSINYTPYFNYDVAMGRTRQGISLRINF